MKKHLLFTFLAVFTLNTTAFAQVIDYWSFTNATTPQNSNEGDAISSWDPNLDGNSWADGVLTWGYDNTAEYKTSSGAYQGDTWLGAPNGTISKLSLTIDAKDIKFSQSGGYGWEFTAQSGEITTGKVRCRITYFGSNVTAKMEGTGSEWNAGSLYDQNDYNSITDLQLTFTWDFANNTMSVDATGSGVLAAGGTGTISLTESVPQDLTAVTNLRSFRTRQQGQGDSYMELDTVAILANGATLSTPNTVLNNAKVWYTKDSNALHIEGVTANSVRVYALSGAKVAQYDNPGNTIALGDLSSGLYIASVLSEHGTKAVKFVK